MLIELVGITASALIVLSLVFKTTTFKGTLIMRIINLIGSVVFMTYGILIWSLSIIIANAATTLLDAYYIWKECKEHKRDIKS